MTTHLLDTDAVVDHLKSYEPTTNLLTQLVATGDVLATCAVVIAEVYTGLAPAERAAAATFIDSLLFLDTTAVMAKHAGELRYDALRRGATLAVADTLIAATALEHGTTLVTGNVRHYSSITGLNVLPLPGRTASRR